MSETGIRPKLRATVSAGGMTGSSRPDGNVLLSGRREDGDTTNRHRTLLGLLWWLFSWLFLLLQAPGTGAGLVSWSRVDAAGGEGPDVIIFLQNAPTNTHISD